MVENALIDGWCSQDNGPTWDGIDFSACFRSRVLNGLLPFVFLTLSLLSCLLLLYSNFSTRYLPLSEATTAITQAENEVLISVVQQESPNLTLEHVLDLRNYARNGSKRNGELNEIKLSWRTTRKAIGDTKKDLLNVFGTAAVLGLLAVKSSLTQAMGENAGVYWFVILFASWVWTFLLTVCKLVLAVRYELYRLRYPLEQHTPSNSYTTLELNIIPWLFVYTFISFFNFRSSLLSHSAPPSSTLLKIDTFIFLLSLAMCSFEIFSPRPSEFSSENEKNPVTKPLEPHASLFSLATFSFMDRFLLSHPFPSSPATTPPPITRTSIPDLRADDKTARVLLGYRQDCNSLGPGRSVTIKLLWHFRSELLLQQFWGYLHAIFIVLPPLFLQQILRFIEKRDRGDAAPIHVVLLFLGGMFLTQIGESLITGQASIIGKRVCIRLRSIIIAEVFTKSLRRKDLAEFAGSAVEDDIGAGKFPKASSGKILNLISVDTFKVSEISGYLHFIWPDLPLTIVITVVLLFRILGVSAIAGLAVLIVLTPLQGLTSKWFFTFQKRLLVAADSRLSLATEVISCIRAVKYFAWEKQFINKMEESREKELAALWMRALAVVAGSTLTLGAPLFVSVATFAFHTKVLHRDLNAETAFTALALFSVLRVPFEAFTDMAVNVLQAHISLARISEFLEEEDTQKFTIVRPPGSASDPVLGFTKASFTWSNEVDAIADTALFRVHDLNLNFPVGQLSIIVGPVGSGKTTLLMSLLGETNKLSGEVFLPSPVVRSSSDEDPSILTDTTAYCAQPPWLLSDTIQANILFGSRMNEARYQTVLDVCALLPDLEQFDLGDATEVGERGVVLSSGQKARISLARAIYSPAKHILADDVLSAVDTNTAQHLFQNCLRGSLMRHRTCILVTHAVDLCAPGASFIVSMEKGAVIASGPREAFVGSDFVASAHTIGEIASGDESSNARDPDKKGAMWNKLKLVKDETQSTGAVTQAVYLLYLQAMGGCWATVATIGLFIVAQMVEIGVSVALRYLTESYDAVDEGAFFLNTSAATTHHRSQFLHPPSFWGRPHSFRATSSQDTEYWFRAYIFLAAANVLLYSGRTAFFLYRGLAASRNLYTRLIDRILGAPIRFFDSTPTGRILNRLSKDCQTIDQEVTQSLAFFLRHLLGAAAILITIAIVLPTFLFAAFFILLAYWVIGYIYLASSRELKRTESVTRSPIFSLFGEALQGVASIRAYSDSGRFIQNMTGLSDDCNRPFFCIWQANRWLAIRVDVAGAIVTLTAALFVVFAKSMDAALAGFIISLAMSFMARILWVVRMWGVVEINLNSVERVKEYLEISQERSSGISPPAIWPSRDGGISVDGLTASYAPGLPPVLDNVTFRFNAREKVGICGRTGSGKSTLGLSFFRFIEPISGRIVIDGIDINTLDLQDLRSRLTIVAQDSALFAGSLRFNLDPFLVYEDAEIWDALRRVQLASPNASSVREERGRVDTTFHEGRYVVKSLDMPLTEGGKNLSAGERQLLALARGILKLQNSTILILDESTSSLDKTTDEIIQKTIRQEMKDATILCIAHRLSTIVDYDKILVLDKGKVIEFAPPWELLNDEYSAFSGLCKNSGEYAALCETAYAKRDSQRRLNN